MNSVSVDRFLAAAEASHFSSNVRLQTTHSSHDEALPEVTAYRIPLPSAAEQCQANNRINYQRVLLYNIATWTTIYV